MKARRSAGGRLSRARLGGATGRVGTQKPEAPAARHECQDQPWEARTEQ